MLVARDKDGTLSLWNKLPYRSGNVWWNKDSLRLCNLNSELFPNLNWEDEPIEVDIVPKNNNDILTKYYNDIYKNNYIVLTKYYENYEESHTWFINMLKRQEHYKDYSEEELEKVWDDHIHDEYSFDEIYAVIQCDGYSKVLFPMGRHDNQHDYDLVCETKEYIDSIIKSK